MTTCVPGNPPSRGVAERNLTEFRKRTAADRDGRRSRRDGGRGPGNTRLLGRSARWCAGMSATVAAEVVRHVVHGVRCGRGCPSRCGWAMPEAIAPSSDLATALAHQGIHSRRTRDSVIRRPRLLVSRSPDT